MKQLAGYMPLARAMTSAGDASSVQRETRPSSLIPQEGPHMHLPDFEKTSCYAYVYY